MEIRKVIVYIAMSIDGYIARPDGDISWLSSVEVPGEDYGYSQFINSVDTVILGRKTYEKVLSFGMPFPHSDKQCYIITHTPKPPEGTIEFYTGDIPVLVGALRSEQGKNIFVDGGAQIVNEFMKHQLVDEFIISIIPVFLGSGIQLFNDGRPEATMKLTNSQSFPSGLVQLHYSR